jgi:putative ABC transport system permease protein
MGEPPRELGGLLTPLAGAGIIFLIVCLSCLDVLRRFHSISAVEALRAGRIAADGRGLRLLSLSRFSLPDVNLTLALRDVLLRSRMFLILALVFFCCSFIILVPLNFLNTIESPGFISYMGIGRSDIRIDLRPGADGQLRFGQMLASLEADPDVRALVPVSTYRCRVSKEASEDFSLNVDTGDFTVFPLEYLEGRSPRLEGEIALSLLNAKEMDVQPGDRLSLIGGNGLFQLEVCGIYQDVTNGGYTAKALSLPATVKGEAIRHTLSLDLRRDVQGERKIREYSRSFAPARVTDIESYLQQTLGETSALVRRITVLAIASALAGCLLITSLFLRMILAKDGSLIAIMKGTGFSREDIGKQYLLKILLVLGLGIIAGTLTANSVGQELVSALWSLMGASRIRFVIDPIRAYVLVPALLILPVILTAGRIVGRDRFLDSCRIADLNAE